MPTVSTLHRCPCCGHDSFVSLLGSRVTADNSLGNALAKGKRWDLPGVDLDKFRRVEWCVCAHCSLIFCSRRPDLSCAGSWYASLFASLEHRGYDRNPLPSRYLQNQEAFATQLFEVLKRSSVFDGVESVIHIRCHAGSLAQQIKVGVGIDEVYGLEYFKHPAEHAALLLGGEHVSRIGTPEPLVPFKRRRFDLVLLEHILTHAHNPREYLNYAKSLLTPGGKLVIFNEQDHGQVLREMRRYPHGINFFHKQLFKQSDLIAFLRSRGLNVRQAPHPGPLKWAAAVHANLFVCQVGEPAPIPHGDVQQTVDLFNGWWSMNRRYRRTKWLTRPTRKLTKRLFGKGDRL